MSSLGPKPWFVGVFKVARITYIYWPIECTPKPSFEPLFELGRITYIYWPMECTIKPSFVKVFRVAKITYIYWPIECTPNPLLKELLEVARITYIYWRIECSPKSLIWMIIQTSKNYLYLLANWVHFKTFICRGVWDFPNLHCTFIFKKNLHVEVCELSKITYISWGFECMSKAWVVD